MRTGFYPKLALNNIRKNAQIYLPYILCAVITSMALYSVVSISTNVGIDNMPGGSTLTVMLGFGTIVVELYSTIILLYTNSFLIKVDLETIF